MSMEPLEGIKVLDLSRLLPGPFCSLLLGDMGADVVKVEAPGRGDYTRWLPPLVDGMGAAFIALNRGKRSITLDLGSSAGQEALRRLASRFDVVLEGFRPGVMAELGLDYETLSRDHPELVYCSLTGYGQFGPLRDRAGHDLNYQALTGMLDATRTADGVPALPGVQAADLAGGALAAALAIVGALFARHRTGRGRYLDISMVDGALSLMMMPLAVHLAAGSGGGPGEWLLSGGLVNYGVYPTRDGRALAVGAIEPKFWTRFLEKIERPDLADLALSDGVNRDRARDALAETIAARTRDEWMALLAGEDVCCDPVLDCDEVVHHPHHLARGMIQEVETGEGPLRTVVTPLPFGPGRWKGSMDGVPLLPRAPGLGEHGEAVLKENGFTVEEIDRLRLEAGL